MDYNDIIIKPVLSEKSTDLATQNKYVFRVATKANKTMVKKAIKEIFNVNADKVNIICMRGKRKRARYQYGYTAAWKKAIVTLKQGDKLDIFETK
ncbi:MAG TPA: 50S ribosomal protein L23 [Spirochaetota bacterium]|nr:50S ribosomal protein L23 [Spirochaetota bacterium]